MATPRTELASRAGVTVETVARLERVLRGRASANANPSLETMERIASSLGPFDLAAVPIGAYEPSEMMRPSHMDPEEAMQAALDLRAEIALGMHYGTFDLSDEPLDEPPQRFRRAASASPIGEQGAWIMKVGETREF